MEKPDLIDIICNESTVGGASADDTKSGDEVPPDGPGETIEQAIHDAVVVVETQDAAQEGAPSENFQEQEVFNDLETIILPVSAAEGNGEAGTPAATVVVVGNDCVMPLTGFVYALVAPTSGMIRRGEDPLTYLNKDQFYGVSMELVQPSPGFSANSAVVSIISVQFREKEKQNTVNDAILHWELWMSRQHSPRLRVIETDHKNNGGILEKVEEIAHNALKVKWRPHVTSAFVHVGVKCLSTDFSNQKGVKGIPLHIQIDTYALEDKHQSNVLDRAFCQIKTFCDKGAERKAREEEKRLQRQPPQYICQPVQQRSLFTRCMSGEFNRNPVLFRPGGRQYVSQAGMMSPDFSSPPRYSTRARTSSERDFASPAGQKRLKSQSPMSSPKDAMKSVRDAKVGPDSPYEERNHWPSSVLMYVRQENEWVFTPLDVVPSVKGFIEAIATKYRIDSSDVRNVYKKFVRGIVVNVDDAMVKNFHDNSFLMRVLATESTQPHVTSTKYDIVLIENGKNPTTAARNPLVR